MLWFHRLAAQATGKNLKSTPTAMIIDQMSESRPLPLGRKEFEDWADRIIAGAMLTGVSARSQKFALADSLLHLGPTESHKPDAHFIHQLRKFAVNQVAIEMRQVLKDEQQAEAAAEVALQESKPN